MQTSHMIRTALLVGTALFLLSACQKDEGPAEKTGKKIDEAVEQSADAMKDAIDTAGEKLEATGEKIQDSANR